MCVCVLCMCVRERGGSLDVYNCVCVWGGDLRPCWWCSLSRRKVWLPAAWISAQPTRHSPRLQISFNFERVQTFKLAVVDVDSGQNPETVDIAKCVSGAHGLAGLTFDLLVAMCKCASWYRMHRSRFALMSAPRHTTHTHTHAMLTCSSVALP